MRVKENVDECGRVNGVDKKKEMRYHPAVVILIILLGSVRAQGQCLYCIHINHTLHEYPLQNPKYMCEVQEQFIVE